MPRGQEPRRELDWNKILTGALHLTGIYVYCKRGDRTQAHKWPWWFDGWADG